jgi:two-component sensor histidine kinase
MAEQLQGTIALERAEGTHFTILVPLGPPPAIS